MYNLLSKSLLNWACIFGLVIGTVVQVMSGAVLPPMANVGTGGQPTTNTGGAGLRSLRGESHWTGAVRLETGEIIPLPHIAVLAGEGQVDGEINGTYWGGYTNIDIGGLIRGAFDNANRFKFTLKYNHYSDPHSVTDNRRRNTEIAFDGQTMGDNAVGTANFTDEYGYPYKGTFAFARAGLGVTAPTPADPGGSGVSVINGAWRGEYVGTYNTYNNIPLSLNLKQQLTSIDGTGTMAGKTVAVKGNVAGSSFNLQIGDSLPQIIINGRVTQDSMDGTAHLYTNNRQLQQGPELAEGAEIGTFKFSR